MNYRIRLNHLSLLRILLQCLLTLSSAQALAQFDGDIKKDYALVTGLTAGVIKDPSRDSDVVLGGLPIGWRITASHNSEISSTYQLSTLLDFGNTQFVRYSGEVGISWHIFGGARYVKKVSSVGTIVGTSPYDFSVPFRASYNQFSVSSPDDYLDRVTGSTVDFKTGAAYRLDILQDAAIGFEVLLAFIGFPASVERLSHSGLDINIVWRAEF